MHCYGDYGIVIVSRPAVLNHFYFEVEDIKTVIYHKNSYCRDSYRSSFVMSTNNTTDASETAPMFVPSDYPIGAVIIILSGFLGALVNGYVFCAVRKAKTFSFAFGRICMSHTAANFGNCFAFGFLIAPILLTNPEFHTTYLGARCGQFLIFVYNASLFSHLLTAINRFCVVCFPLKYNILFDERTTKMSIALVWTIALIQVVPYFSFDCTLYFDAGALEMVPHPTLCSLIVILYMCYYLSVLVIAIFGVLDFLTFIGIYFHSKNRVGSTTSKAKERREIRFFFQASVQDFAFLSELILYFSIAPYFMDNKWAHFMLTTFAWIAVHTVDGYDLSSLFPIVNCLPRLIVIAFNKEIRGMIMCRGNAATVYNTSGAQTQSTTVRRDGTKPSS
uniref:G_PROTEIN_RECEP_F1_2 domain-containing protein n=1 Tax=Steinernema glaseri TaxID=37863 RepID=A0A1I7YKH2_9BILA